MQCYVPKVPHNKWGGFDICSRSNPKNQNNHSCVISELPALFLKVLNFYEKEYANENTKTLTYINIIIGSNLTS